MIASRWYWLGLLVSACLLGVAYFYFQLALGLAPCPLCMFQRICLIGVIVFCLLGIVFKPKVVLAKLISFGVLTFSVLGLLLAGRQVWLQHLPAEKVPECGPDLAFMLQAFPLMEVVETVLSGSGECAEVQWQFIGFSMPEWMLFIFFVYVVIALRLLLKKQRNYFSGSYGR